MTWSQRKNSARASEVKTLKDHPAAMSAGIFLRYRLSGNSHPGSAENSTLTRRSPKVSKLDFLLLGPFLFLKNSAENLTHHRGG